MIEYFVKRPVTTIMFVLVFVVLGITSYFNLLIEETPKINFPIVTISVVYPGATPLEVEQLIVNKIEDAVAEISEIKKIRSQSYDNFGYVYVEFLLSADVNVKSIEVKDKVEAILNELPDDAEKPVIEKYDPLMQPVMELILWSDTVDTRDMYEFADKTLRNRFSAVEGVAKVDVYGGKERQINVRLDPMLMKERYITAPEVITALKLKNKNIPAGDLEKGYDALSVRFVGEFQNVDEIANMRLTSADGTTFALKDIAVIEDSFKKVDSMARYNGREVVGLSVKKVSDGNAINIARDIKKKLGAFRAILPAGMHLDIATDTTTFISDETVDAEINILIGILLTVIILYLFTGRFNLTFIAAIVIPTSLVSTFSLMDASGFSINFLTLLSIATALGTLIANAIVIIENVLAHLEHKETPEHAAIDGTKEVAGAVIASTGTNLVVFTPIAMMGGIVGQFMRSFGLTVVYATLFSLLASFTLTPMLCAMLLKKKKPEDEGKKANPLTLPFIAMVRLTNNAVEFLKREYKRIFEWTFRHPAITIISMILLFYSLKFIMPYIDGEFAPSSDRDSISIELSMPKGSTIERTVDAVKGIEGILDTVNEKKSYLVNIGQNGVENATITLDLVPSTERKRSDSDIMRSLVPLFAEIPDAEIHMSGGGMGSKNSDQGDVSINLYGIDYDTMIKLSREVKSAMEDTGYFRSVKLSYKEPKTEERFIPDQQKLINYGLNASTVGMIVRASVYGEDSNVYKENGEEYDINVELDDAYAQTSDDIKEISVLSRKGLIPITELGTLEEGVSLPAIWHRDKERVIRAEGYLAKGALGPIRSILAERFKKINFPDGYGYTFVGDSEHQDESSNEVGKAFLLAVILTYMLLCAVMNSFRYPIAILLTVATSFIGVFYALFFMGQSINIASMLGMIMLVGLVVNNAILLLDYAIMKINEGLSVKDALWLGASEKFRAILMTSIAIILGILPQIWSITKTKQSMGVVMIGGMIASIISTFLFVPVIFWGIEKISKSFTKK